MRVLAKFSHHNTCNRSSEEDNVLLIGAQRAYFKLRTRGLCYRVVQCISCSALLGAYCLCYRVVECISCSALLGAYCLCYRVVECISCSASLGTCCLCYRVVECISCSATLGTPPQPTGCDLNSYKSRGDVSMPALVIINAHQQ